MSSPFRPSGTSETAAGAAAGGTQPARARILVVDDIPANRSVLQRWLARQGHEVESAENGRIALEMIATHGYDLVLLDVTMPELDGYEVLRRLKSEPATRDIPVIMVSGLDELEGIARCIQAGAEDYLPKPFEPVILAARVGSSLDKKRLRDAELVYMRQVARLAEAARALEAGRYAPGSLGDVAVRPDELGRLARMFDTMATEVRSREERLQARIEALRAEMGAGTRAPTAGRHPATAVTEQISDTSHAPAHGRGGEPERGALFAQRFDVVSRIGEGGMGVVYRARDRELGEDVAIKLLQPHLHWEDANAIERFKSEIRLARQISSPHVVRTHDLGEWQGAYYLTMEYVEGITVRQLIERRGKLTPPATLGIATQLARALDSAHRQGVIHRDIKPENLLLDQEGVLKVMDFGIALMAQGTKPRTKEGVIVGTPAYMSPEQLVGDRVDARTDLYATGVVLYECLTGHRPIEADNVFMLVAKVLQEEPVAPATLSPEVPAALSALVMRLMAKRREDRPSSAAELSQLLAALA